VVQPTYEGIHLGQSLRPEDARALLFKVASNATHDALVSAFDFKAKKERQRKRDKERETKKESDR
jgi:hypothetical protein